MQMNTSNASEETDVIEASFTWPLDKFIKIEQTKTDYFAYLIDFIWIWTHRNLE